MESRERVESLKWPLYLRFRDKREQWAGVRWYVSVDIFCQWGCRHRRYTISAVEPVVATQSPPAPCTHNPHPDQRFGSPVIPTNAFAALSSRLSRRRMEGSFFCFGKAGQTSLLKKRENLRERGNQRFRCVGFPSPYLFTRNSWRVSGCS